VAWDRWPRAEPTKTGAVSSRLGPIVAPGAEEALDLSSSLGDPLLIGDQRLSGRAPAPGPPDLPGRVALARLGQDPAAADAGLSASGSALRPDPASASSRSSCSADNDATSRFLGVVFAGLADEGGEARTCRGGSAAESRRESLNRLAGATLAASAAVIRATSRLPAAPR